MKLSFEDELAWLSWEHIVIIVTPVLIISFGMGVIITNLIMHIF